MARGKTLKLFVKIFFYIKILIFKIVKIINNFFDF